MVASTATGLVKVCSQWATLSMLSLYQVRWNACFALSHVFQSEAFHSLEGDWAVCASAMEALVDSVQTVAAQALCRVLITSPNFKA
jgi:hypothetical protein